MTFQSEMIVFGGTSNPTLTREICEYLGIEPGRITASAFSDGETLVEIGRTSADAMSMWCSPPALR